MRIEHNDPGAKAYIGLRMKSGMGVKDEKRSEIALRNSLFIVCIYSEMEDGKEELIGFGRVVGDGGITFVVSDVMVDSRFQRNGLGTIIMQEIDKYLKENTYEDSYVCLIANSPADKLYNKFSFSYLSNDSCGMLRVQK